MTSMRKFLKLFSLTTLTVLGVSTISPIYADEDDFPKKSASLTQTVPSSVREKANTQSTEDKDLKDDTAFFTISTQKLFVDSDKIKHLAKADFYYPQIHDTRGQDTRKINTYLFEYVRDTLKSFAENESKNEQILELSSAFDIVRNDPCFLSIIFTFDSKTKKGEDDTLKTAMTIDPESLERIKPSEVEVSLGEISEAIKEAEQKLGFTLKNDKIKHIPENFYVDDGNRLNFVFSEGEIAKKSDGEIIIQFEDI